MSARVSLTIGARVFACHEDAVVGVQLLDRAPAGWWVTVEGRVDGKGRPLVVNVATRDLHASRSAAETALTRPAPATKRNPA